MTSSDAVRKRMALALSEFFVVSLSGLDFAWRSHAIASWWDMLSSQVTGNFRNLLQDVTLHPAMGYYLNTKGNLKENVATGRAPDENYAREVMQLFSLGLHQLNNDGTEKRDANGNKLESYTQSDVNTLEPVNNRNVPNTVYTRIPMRLTANNHSTLASNFLGATVAAGTDGAAALKIARDTLFNHSNVGPFLASR